MARDLGDPGVGHSTDFKDATQNYVDKQIPVLLELTAPARNSSQ